MALKIRLQRRGGKKNPFYHVVVTDSRNARNGRFIEKLGHYNPMVTPSAVSFKTDRIAHWYRVGARPSDTVSTLLRKTNVDIAALAKAPQA
jgi:small subunit ribosomal protein S16